MNRQIFQLPMHAIGPRHPLRLGAGHAAAAHDMGAHHLEQARLHWQRQHRRARLRPRGVGRGHFMQRKHLLRARRKLDFHHRQQRPACPVHHVVAERVVEHGGMVCAQAHLAARGLVMKAVAQQRQQRVVVRKRRQQVMLPLTETGHGRSKNQRMQRRRFQLVAHDAINRLGLQKMVGVNRLGRAAPGFDFLRKYA